MSTNHLTAEQVISALDRCMKNEEEETCMYCAGCPASVHGEECQTRLFKEAKRLLKSCPAEAVVKVRGSFIKGENYCQCGFQLMGRPDFQPKFCHQCGRRLNWYEVTDYEEGKTWWNEKWESENKLLADKKNEEARLTLLTKVATTLADIDKDLKDFSIHNPPKTSELRESILNDIFSLLHRMRIPEETYHTWRNIYNDAIDRALQELENHRNKK